MLNHKKGFERQVTDIYRHKIMSRKSKIATAIDKLIENGYNDARLLAQKTGLSERQCRRYLTKFQSAMKYRCDILMIL